MTCKPSLLYDSNYKHNYSEIKENKCYFGYVGATISKGLFVRLHENLSGFKYRLRLI